MVSGELLDILCRNQYWAQKQHFSESVEEFYQSCPPEFRLAKFKYKPHAGYSFQIKSVPPNTESRVTILLMSLIREQNPDLICHFLVSIGDGIHPPINSGGPSADVPILAFGKLIEDPYTILIPDPDFVRSHGEQDFQTWVDDVSETLTWHKKIPKVFWRGNTTGYQMLKPYFEDRLRYRLVSLSHSFNLPNQLDVYFSGFKQIEDEDVKEAILSRGLVRQRVDFKEFFHYKYLVEVDGNSCPWSFLRKLRTRSVVLKVDSPLMQWYYPLLHPWEHYVPIKGDLSDYKEKLDWVYSNDAECKRIGERASQMARLINMKLGVAYTTQAIKMIAKGQVSRS